MRLSEVPGPWRFLDGQPEASRHALSTREFTFLNHTVAANGAIPWSNQQEDKLWLYHLNYFDFLSVHFSLPDDEPLLKAGLEIALDWRHNNTQGTEVGWEPYPLSVRIVNWLKFLARHQRALERLGEETKIHALLESLGQQTATLAHRLEKDLLANHLLKNIKALLFAGALLETSRSSWWWAEGEKLLEQELNEQVLPDGGHFERSPMYHSQVLEDLAEIQVLCASTGRHLQCAELLSQKVRAMSRFLQGILHSDGEIPLFNDSELDGARAPESLLASASTDLVATAETDPRVTLFPHTGYGIIRSAESRSALVFDCGPLGPDYQPGHGHCDVLSYELSLHGQRVVVDTGVSTYQRSSERIYERSTAAHNTVRIDGEDQAEVWASFRVGRRPRVGKLKGGSIGPYHFLRGEHYGYERRGVVHARQIMLGAGGAWIVVDLLKGKGHHLVESFIHLHSGVQVRTLGEPLETGECAPQHRWLLDFARQTYFLLTFGDGVCSFSESWHSEGFRRPQASQVLRWTWEGTIPWLMAYAFVPKGVPAPRVALDASRRTVEIEGHPVVFD